MFVYTAALLSYVAPPGCSVTFSSSRIAEPLIEPTAVDQCDSQIPWADVWGVPCDIALLQLAAYLRRRPRK